MKNNYHNRRFGNKSSANVATNNANSNDTTLNNDFVGFIASGFLSVHVSSSDFILDSGATNHMSNNESYFSFLKRTSPTKVGGIVGTLNSVGIGNIDMITASGIRIQLTNVLYIPDLPLNLISVVYLESLGVSTFFEANQVKIYKDNMFIGTGTQVKNGLCKLDATILESKQSYQAIANVAGQINKISLEILHRRFDHISVHSLKKFYKSGNIDGLRWDYSDDQVNHFKCDACLSSKAHRVPFQPSKSHASAPLELVHSDVLTFPTASLSGKRYLVSFVDDYSRKTWAAIIMNKSDVFQAFKIWKTEVENVTENKIKTFRYDNRGE